MIKEEWKPIIYRDIKQMYEISSLGRIRNYRTGKFLTPVRNVSNDHYQVSLRLNESSKKWNGKRSFSFHILVAITFIPNPENKPLVHHIDGDPSNNKVDNLMWVTVSEHQVLTYELEQRDRKFGEKSENARYTTEQYAMIVDLILEDPTISIKELSERTGIAVPMVREFVRGNIKWPDSRKDRSIDHYMGLNGYDEETMRKVFELAQDINMPVAEISRITKVNSSTVSSVVNHCVSMKWRYLYNEYDIPNRNNSKMINLFDKRTDEKIRKLLKQGKDIKEIINKLHLDNGLYTYTQLYRYILKIL